MVKAKETAPVPPVDSNPEWVDVRGVEYVGRSDDDGQRTYLTTHELAKELAMYPETLYRWCVKWFGNLPAGRTGGKMGYRIPLEYRLVAKVWLRTEDARIREVARRALLESPRDFVVVVDNIGSTHYSVSEAVNRVESLSKSPTFRGSVITLLFVGQDD